MEYSEIIKKLKSLANPKNVAGMARFGINPKNTLGVSIPNLRALAKKIGKSPAFAKATAGRHKLAQQLWASGIHEARILAGMIDDVAQVTEKQIDNWAKDFDSWDVCDQVCMNLFDKTSFAFKKALKLADEKKEFVKRTGFTLMACLAWHDKNSPDSKFQPFFSKIKKHSTDERNYVRKAVNWALRHIGKRNKNLNEEAIKVARQISKIPSKTAKWIAGDALRELTSNAVQKRLK